MFRNRLDAGKLLAKEILPLVLRDSIVVALARGGVVVGRQVADILQIPLFGLVVKKLRAPQNLELAIGAVTSDGTKYINWELALKIPVEQEYLDTEIQTRKKEALDVERKYTLQCADLKRIVEKKNVFLVDDGVATGSTAKTAILWLKDAKAKKIILAVPVIAKDTCSELQSKVGKIVALEVSDNFSAVGQFYEEFGQVTDEEVIKLISNKPINQ